MTTAQEIAWQLSAKAQGGPYAVTPTADGAHIHLNVADMTWVSLLRANHISVEYGIELKLDEVKQRYSLEQRVRDITWSAGSSPSDVVPVFSAHASVSEFRGTTFEARKVIVGGVHTDGKLINGYSLDSREMKEFVESVMRPSGWKKTMDRNSRIGLFAAIIGGGVAVLGAVVAVVIVALQ